MPLSTQSKPAAAQASNTEGEGDDVASFNVKDPDGKWYVAKSFPLIDPESGTRFEAGTPTRATETNWIKNQVLNRAMTEVEQPEDAKGKAATKVNPDIDETPKADADSMGNGMQSSVAGS